MFIAFYLSFLPGVYLYRPRFLFWGLGGRQMTTKHSLFTTRYIAVTAILSSLAFVLQLIEVPLPMIMPTFIKFDLSDLPPLVASFSLGPICGVLVELFKNLLHALLSSHSFGVGELSNFMLGAVFVGVAGAYYKHNKTKKGAIIGSFLGAISMAIISFPANLFIVYPVYYNFMPKDVIIQAYQAIFPAVDSIEKCLLIFNVPFTFVKGMIDVIITLFLYKKISPIIHGNN